MPYRLAHLGNILKDAKQFVKTYARNINKHISQNKKSIEENASMVKCWKNIEMYMKTVKKQKYMEMTKREIPHFFISHMQKYFSKMVAKNTSTKNKYIYLTQPIFCSPLRHQKRAQRIA